MIKNRAKLLIAALESGEYKQGQGRLRTPEGNTSKFCCLGVACNVHAQHHPEIACHQ